MSPSVISALKYEEHIMVGIVLGIWEATGQLSDIVENGNRAINLCAILRIGSNLIASRAFLPPTTRYLGASSALPLSNELSRRADFRKASMVSGLKAVLIAIITTNGTRERFVAYSHGAIPLIPPKTRFVVAGHRRQQRIVCCSSHSHHSGLQ